MKTLLILRHAKSSWDDPDIEDFDRPLNKRGCRDAPRMGQLLCTHLIVPDMIISSDAARARATAETVAEHSGYAGEIRFRHDLYHADPDVCIEVLRTLDEDETCVMIVGHNPGLEQLLECLTGVPERLQTAAVAQISLPINSWHELTVDTEGTLQDLWRPRELPNRL